MNTKSRIGGLRWLVSAGLTCAALALQDDLASNAQSSTGKMPSPSPSPPGQSASNKAQSSPVALRAERDGLALTPPMGWYPWNIFGEEPQNEKLIKEIVDALVSSGMKDAGYAYVGPDEGICFYRKDDGRLTTNLERYPSGLRGLGDYIHKKGLKYALYTDAGTRTCSKAMPGTKGREFEDMQAFADWRADYIKIDWCNAEGQDIVKTYTTLRDAQLAAGRPIVHSLCSWGEGYPWRWAATRRAPLAHDRRYLRPRAGGLGPGHAHGLRQREAAPPSPARGTGTTRT